MGRSNVRHEKVIEISMLMGILWSSVIGAVAKVIPEKEFTKERALQSNRIG
jgi:hypothetical protein